MVPTVLTSSLLQVVLVDVAFRHAALHVAQRAGVALVANARAVDAVAAVAALVHASGHVAPLVEWNWK